MAGGVAEDCELRGEQVWSYPAGGAVALSKQGILNIAQQSGRLAAIKVQ